MYHSQIDFFFSTGLILPSWTTPPTGLLAMVSMAALASEVIMEAEVAATEQAMEVITGVTAVNVDETPQSTY